MILVTNNEGTPGVGVTADLLRQGSNAIDAIEGGIRLVEASESVRTVGRGGWPNLLGEVELDAAMMDGDTLKTGAIGGLKGYMHPVSIAREVMQKLPHEFLVGEGAARFAAEIGAETGELLMPHSIEAWKRWYAAEVSESDKANWPNVPLAPYCRSAIDPEIGRDTTVFLAKDSFGKIAVGTSTSGWGWKYPGRLGDSPVVGAGFYADTRFGACACTGAGEMSIRLSTARSVVLYMKMGMSIADAVYEAANDMEHLRGGLISRVTIHAIDKDGRFKVVAVNGSAENSYWLWEGRESAPTSHQAEVITLRNWQNKKTATNRYTQGV